jgi:hypothetical protein
MPFPTSRFDMTILAAVCAEETTFAIWLWGGITAFAAGTFVTAF